MLLCLILIIALSFIKLSSAWGYEINIYNSCILANLPIQGETEEEAEEKPNETYYLYEEVVIVNDSATVLAKGGDRFN